MFDISISKRSRSNSVVAFALTRVACCPLPLFLFFTFVRPKRLSRVQNASLLARLSSFPTPFPALPSVASSFVHRAEKTRALLVLLKLPKGSTMTIRPPYLFPWWHKRSSSSNRRRVARGGDHDVDATPPRRRCCWKNSSGISLVFPRGLLVGAKAIAHEVVVISVLSDDDDDDDDERRTKVA